MKIPIHWDKRNKFIKGHGGGKKDKSTPRQYIPAPPHTIEWYRKRLIDKYGAEIIDDLKALKTRQYWTLTALGEKYSFSKEYARQIFKTIFGESYGKYGKEKTAKRRADAKMLECANDPRHKVANYEPGIRKSAAKSELLVFNKCKELGFDVEIPCDAVFDLKINNFNVDVKSTSKTTKVVPKHKQATASEYFHFGTEPSQHVQCDFYICHVIPKDIFYIIPQNAMGPSGCHIRANNVRYRTDYIPKRLDYEQYRDAWGLLSGLHEIPHPIYKEAVKKVY